MEIVILIRWRLFLTPILACIAATPAAAQASDPLVGCYQLTIDGKLPFSLPPHRIRLSADTGRSAFEHGQRLIRAVPDSSERPYPFSYWYLDGDSLTLVWTGGEVVTEVRMALGPDPLRGMAIQESDAIGGQPVLHRPATLRRIPCPS